MYFHAIECDKRKSPLTAELKIDQTRGKRMKDLVAVISSAGLEFSILRILRCVLIILDHVDGSGSSTQTRRFSLEKYGMETKETSS